MSGNESNGKWPTNGSDQEEPFTIIDAPSPSPESNGNAVTENEIMDGMSDVHVSETAGARQKDEYDVDFE